MTILAHKKSDGRGQRGISLLEIVIAILVMSLLATIGLVVYNGQVDDRALRDATVKFEALSSRARSLSFLKQVPHRIALKSGGEVVLLAPLADQSKDRAEGRREGGEETGGFHEVSGFETDLQVSLRRWGAKEDAWEQSTEQKPVYWRFSPSGLCEPVSVRFREGENWIILHMHPLTGQAEEIESVIQ